MKAVCRYPNLQFLHRWSYLVNLTFIGNAVYLSMDLPDSVFAVCSELFADTQQRLTSLQLSKLLNYIQWNKSKTVTFACFVCIWRYVSTTLTLF